MTHAALWSPTDPPRQGLGLMRLREVDGDPDRDPVAVVHAALDQGITLLDTAELYDNEELVGRTIAGRRDEVLLCTKFGIHWDGAPGQDDWSVRADAATVTASCERSLRRLGVETIDLYYLHHRSEDTPIEETVLAMSTLVEAGKIRAIGLSNVTDEDIRRAQAVHPVQAVQEQWSLESRAVEPMLTLLRENAITLVAHSPTGHGALHQQTEGPLAGALHEIARVHQVTAGQVALAWVHEQGRRLGQPVVPLPGTTSVRHLTANALASDLRFDEAEVARLGQLA